MNELDKEIDRLVDGELHDAEYRRLLTALDQNPEGWKRCAIAFLENQAFKKDLMEINSAVAQDIQPSHSHTPAEKHPSRSSNIRAAAQFFALAASVLLAFGLGRGWTPNTSEPPTTLLPTPAPERSTPPLPYPDSPHGSMTLLVNNPGSGLQEMELPVVDGRRVDPQSILQRPLEIPQEVRDALLSSGHRIESRRELVPLQVDSERDVIVPVDRVRLIPARRPMY